MRTLRAPFAVFMTFAAACGGSTWEDMPPGWGAAEPLEVHQSACRGDGTSAAARPRLLLDKTGGTLTGTYADASFRCGQQDLCGYVLDAREVTGVLVQPCDLHPMHVVRCECLYTVSFALAARPGRTTVALYRRGDLHGAAGNPEAVFVGKASVPH
jgi:hypothetical protein